eukprot:UN05303
MMDIYEKQYNGQNTSVVNAQSMSKISINASVQDRYGVVFTRQASSSASVSDNEDVITSGNEDSQPGLKALTVVKSARDYENELSAPLIASAARRSNLGKSEKILLQTHDDPTMRERQKKHELFLKVLSQLVTSYNKKFLTEIKQILLSVNSELRPPHSFDNYPCGFNDCIYCHLKSLLQTNLQSLP